MSEWAAKVFWSDVEIREGAAGWEVLLDGRKLKTPAKSRLSLPTQALAALVADEWRAQTDKIDPTTMPATRMVNSAVDKVMHQREAVADHLADYAATDLVCYRADRPAELVSLQAAGWDPLLDWAKQTFDADLVTVAGVMPVDQDPNSLSRLRSAIRSLDAFRLAAFSDLVTLSGSVVIGLAVSRNHIKSDHAWELSRIDEQFQIEQWGHDDEAVELSARKQADFRLAQRVFASV